MRYEIYSEAPMKITSIRVEDEAVHVSFTDGNIVGSRIYHDAAQLVQFLRDCGWYMSDFKIGFDVEPFSESVTMVGSKQEWPRGYRDPPIISDEAVGDIEITLEEVMNGFAPIYIDRTSKIS